MPKLRNWSDTVHLSMSLTMIPFSTYFVSIGLLFSMETKPMLIASSGGKNGTANFGGTSLRTFAEDGDTSSSGLHPTSIFPSFVHLETQYQICWRIHLHFRSS